MLAGNHRSTIKLVRSAAALTFLIVASAVAILLSSHTASAQETGTEADTAPTVSDASELRTHTVEVGEWFSVTLPAADEGSGNGGPYNYNVWHQGQAASFTNGIDGITFDPDARTLSGTPQRAGLYKMSYVIHDGDGNRDRTDAFRNRDSLRIEVTEPAPKPTPEPTPTPTPTPEPEIPPYFPASVDNYQFTQGQDIGTVALPEAAGGAGDFTYALSPALPAGLAFAPAVRALTGAPPAVSDSVDYTYTATDANGAQAELTFTIEVLPGAAPPEGQSSRPPHPTVIDLTTENVPSSEATGVTRLSWAPSPDNAYFDSMDYTVMVRVKGDTVSNPVETQRETDRNITSMEWDGLAYNIDHQFRLRANGSLGSVVYAGNLHEWTDFTTAPGPMPTGLTVERERVGETDTPKLRASWTSVAPAASYQYQFRKVEEGASWGGPFDTDSADTTLVDGEAGSLYEVQVRASGEGVWNRWTESVQARFNRPPQKLGNGRHDDRTVAKGGRHPANGLWNEWFSDPDGDTLLPFAKSSDPARVSIELIWGLDHGNLFDYEALNQGQATLTYGVTDGYGGKFTEVPYTITVTHSETREIAERSPGRTPVGAPVTGVPYGGETLAYALNGDAAAPDGPFIIDSDSGQIRVAPGVTLRYQGNWCRPGRSGPADTNVCQPLPANKSFTGQVSYTVGGQPSAIDLTIRVTEAVVPDAPGTPTVTRTRFNVKTPPALDVTWTAPNTNGVALTGYEAQYRKQGAAAWTDYGHSLAAGATTLNLPDLEPGAIYEVQVRATSASGPGLWSETGEGRANRPPQPGAWSYANADLKVGGSYRDWYPQKRYFGDADGDTLTFFTRSSNPALISAWVGDNGNTMNLSVVNPGRATLTYGVVDGYGGKVFRAVVYSGRANGVRRVPESPRGYYVGYPVAGNRTWHNYAISPYTLIGEAAATFDINPSNGQITLKPGRTLDYETKSAYTGQVKYTVNGGAAVIGLTIQVTDLPAPNKPLPPTVTAVEGSDSSLSLGWTAPWSHYAPITDYDLRYRQQGISPPPEWTEHSFEGAGVSTTLTGLTSGAKYFVQVRAASAEGTSPWSDSGWIGARPPTITPDPTPEPITDPDPDPDGDGDPEEQPTENPDGANTAPYFSRSAYSYVDEASAAGTAVGSPVTATDAEKDKLTYSISMAGQFTIDRGTAQIRVAEGAKLSRATTPSHIVTVSVSDGKDSSGATDLSVDDSLDVTIHITDSDHPPSLGLAMTLAGPVGPRLTANPFDVIATFSEAPGPYDLASANLRTPLNAQQSGTVVTFSGVQPGYDGSRWGTSPYTSRISVDWRGLSEVYEVSVDPDPPRVHLLSGPSETQKGVFTAEIQLTETVEGFTADDLDVNIGEVTALRNTGQWLWEADIRPTANGALTVDIAANKFQDVSGHGNTAAQQYTVQVNLLPSTPGAPKLLQSTADPSSILNVLWAAPQILDGPPITGYDVQYQEAGAAEWINHPFQGANPVTTLRDLADGTTYQSQVRARNAHGVSEWSDPGQGSTWRPPTDMEIEFGRPNLDIICDPDQGGYPGAGGYKHQNVIADGARLSPQQVADPMPAEYFVVLDASCVEGDNVSIRGSDRESDFEWTWHQTGSANFLPYYSLSGGGIAGTKRSGVEGSAISFDCGNEGWRPPHGEYVFVVTVTKDGEFYQKQFVSFTIGNPPPPAGAGGSGDPAPETTAEAGPDLAGAPGQSVTLQGMGSTNPYGEWWQMEHQWTQLSGPTVTLSDATVGDPSFTLPDDAEVGTTLEFQLTITDKEGQSDSDTVTVTVLPKLKACAGPDLAGAPGNEVTLQGRCSTNPYGKWYQMVHSWTQLSGPTVTLSDPTKGAPTFTIPADAAEGTTLEFQLTVTDKEGQSDSDTMIVTVAAPEAIRPTAKAGPDLTGAPGEIVTLQGTDSTNPYGAWWRMAHQWTQLSGPTVTLSDATVGNPSFTLPADAEVGTTLEFQLTVTDKEGETDSDTVTVTVQSGDSG